MFEEYEDIFCEPSEIELIIEKARTDIANLFTDKVKSDIEEAKKAEVLLAELNANLRAAQYKLETIKAEITAAQEKINNAEMYDIPKKYINRFIKNATGNYAPGDTVWVIKQERNQTNCALCNGAKKITVSVGGINKEVQCPDCKGYGYIVEYPNYVAQSKVREVRLKLCFKSDRVSYWNTESVFLDNNDFFTKPEKIFPTEEAALKALKGGADNA